MMYSHPDTLTMYGLSAMLRHPAAADRAMRHGPELLPAGPARAVATLILTGDRRPLDWLSRDARRNANALGRAVLRCTVPGLDEEWAVYLVDLLAQDRHLPLLAVTLRWAADRVMAGVPLRHLRRCIDDALRLAEGLDDRTNATLLGGMGVAA
ncbi:MAG: hypothetical protein KF869_15340 [Phycisphaeraceae bacterium]|nr:hypothetical protein [Phycisphaeraceae bacterium]